MNEFKRPDLSPGTDVGGLVVEALIGAGGFGTVYRARHPESGNLYALKFIPLEYAEAWGQREFSTLLRFNHPNLVSLRGAGHWPVGKDEFLWLQMAYIPGRELDVWADQENPGALEALGKVLDVGRGLAVAHQARVVHRDVKEANILVRDDDGSAVLVDFGAGHYSRAHTITQGMFPPGTLDYRSPEAWRFREEHRGQQDVHYRAQAADDLYALGVVLYRLLTHRLPFAVTESEESIRAVIHQPPLPPHLVNPRVPKILSGVCLKLLAKTPESRYPSAVALCEELEALQERADAAWRMPLRAPRPPPGRRPVRPWTRTALALLLVVALGTAGGWWLTLPIEPIQEISRGGEVAHPPPAPEAEPTAAPPLVGATPVVAAPPVAPAEDPAPVKNPQKSRESQSEPKRQRSAVRKACVGLAGLALQACVGAQPREALPVRQGPPPEACPAGAVAAMRKLRISIGFPYSTYMRPNEGAQLVREGPYSTHWAGSSQLPLGTVLSGRLYYTPGRLYVRITEVRTPKGEVYPVCMEMVEDGVRGSRMEEGSSPEHLLLHSLEDYRPVERFE